MLNRHGHAGGLPLEEMRPPVMLPSVSGTRLWELVGAVGMCPVLPRYRPHSFCLLPLKEQLETQGMVFWLCCLVRNSCHTRFTFVGQEVFAQGLTSSLGPVKKGPRHNRQLVSWWRQQAGSLSCPSGPAGGT